MSRKLPLPATQTEVDFTVAQLNGAGGVVGGTASDGSMTVTGANGTSAASAANPVPVKAAPAVPLGYLQITGPTGAVNPFGTIPTGATYAIIQPVTQGISWRDDGTSPTTTVGMTVPAGGELLYDGTLATFRMIQLAATSVVNVSFYR